MSEAKFTKGAWVGFKDGSWPSDDINEYNLGSNRCHSWVEITCNGEAVAIVPDCEGELEPNAHLIAAAPEMYTLINDLRHAVSMGGIGGGINNNEVLKSMDTLLAKARGEQIS